MKDHNDFFDEMIDVDDEGEEFVGEGEGYEYDEEEEEEDDGLAVVRTAVLRKDDMLALLSLKASADGGQIVRFDPRDRLPSMRSYESEEEALKWYARSLATSRRNGWAVVYDGTPLVG